MCCDQLDVDNEGQIAADWSGQVDWSIVKQAPFNHQENRDNVSCSAESNNVSQVIWD